MSPTEYFDDEKNEEDDVDINNLREKIYNDFMSNLEIVADMVRVFPPSWQLQMLVGIMRDI